MLTLYPQGRLALCPTSGSEPDWARARYGVILAYTKHWDKGTQSTPDAAMPPLDSHADAAVLGICAAVPSSLADHQQALGAPVAPVPAKVLRDDGWAAGLPLCAKLPQHT